MMQKNIVEATGEICMSNYKERERKYISAIEKTELPSNTEDEVRRYIQTMSFRLSASSRYQYLCDLITFLKYFDNPTLEELSSLTQRDFDDYLLYLKDYEKDDGNRGGNNNPALKRKLSGVRSFYDYLARTYDDNENIQLAFSRISKVILPKHTRKKVITFMDREEKKNFRHVVETADVLTEKQKVFHEHTGVRDKAICDLLLATGLRLSEVSNLDVSDVDLEKKNLICIRKGGFADKIYFSDEAAESLEDYLMIRDTFITEVSTENDRKALFLSIQHHRMGDQAIRNMIEKYAKVAVPQKHITPHKLRATFATELYSETRDIYAVAEQLGHKNVETTKNYYAQISEEIKKENRNKIKLD